MNKVQKSIDRFVSEARKGEYAAVLGYMVVNNREQFEDDVGREGELKLSLLGERFVTIQHY